jgi:hypothetical protein
VHVCACASLLLCLSVCVLYELGVIRCNVGGESVTRELFELVRADGYSVRPRCRAHRSPNCFASPGGNGAAGGRGDVPIRWRGSVAAVRGLDGGGLDGHPSISASLYKYWQMVLTRASSLTFRLA